MHQWSSVGPSNAALRSSWGFHPYPIHENLEAGPARPPITLTNEFAMYRNSDIKFRPGRCGLRSIEIGRKRWLDCLPEEGDS